MLLLLVSLPDDAAAQLFTPTFASPRLINEVGLHLSDGPGDLTLEAIWRRGLIGLRLGYVDRVDALASLSAEFRTPIPSGEAPVALTFSAGAQGLFGGGEAAGGLQAGLIAGYTAIQPGMAITPYLHPRIAALSDLEEDEVQARALADVGVDLEFWNGLLFRFTLSLADIGARWGFGAAIRR